MIQFRFDIDSLTDLQVGMSPVIELFDQYDIKADFFINVGKSVDRKYLLKSARKQTDSIHRQDRADDYLHI